LIRRTNFELCWRQIPLETDNYNVLVQTRVKVSSLALSTFPVELGITDFLVGLYLATKL